MEKIVTTYSGLPYMPREQNICSLLANYQQAQAEIDGSLPSTASALGFCYHRLST